MQVLRQEEKGKNLLQMKNMYHLLSLFEPRMLNKQLMMNIRVKSIRVCKGYAHIEGIDYGETYARVAGMEEIRLIIDYACSKRVKVYQMDVKASFLNGKLEEEVYMEKTEGFQLFEAENHVYLLNKSLYGIEQAPRAWY